MTLIIVDQGEEQMLDEIVATAVNLRLFTTDVTTGLTAAEIDALDETDFTEATFTGYATVALTSGSWTSTPGNPSTATTAAQTFTASGVPGTENVWGYYYTRTSDGLLRGFEQFDAPLVVTTAGDFVTVTPTLTLDDKEGSDVVPGMMLPQGFAAAPTGWLLCDGTAVSRSTYAELFAAISTTFGVGDGSTTFNLPDIRQKTVLGQAASGTGSTLGGTGGTIDHVHTLAGTGAAAAIVLDSGGTVENREVSGLTAWTRTDHITGVTQAGSSGTTTLGTELVGSSDTANPPFIALPWVIKT